MKKSSIYARFKWVFKEVSQLICIKLSRLRKEKHDRAMEQMEAKKAQRELFKGFVQALEKQGTLIEEFNEGIWSSLVQEVVINSKDDIRFIFKNGFETKTRYIKS